MKKIFFLTLVIVDIAMYFAVFKFEDGMIARKFFTYNKDLYSLTQSYKKTLTHSIPVETRVTYLEDAPKTETLVRQHVCLSGKKLYKHYSARHPLPTVKPSPIQPPKIILNPKPVPTPPQSLIPTGLFSNLAARTGRTSGDWEVCGDVVFTKETCGLVEYEDGLGKHQAALSYVTASWDDAADIYHINDVHVSCPQDEAVLRAFVDPQNRENVLFENDYILQAVIGDISNPELTNRPTGLYNSFDYLFNAVDGYTGAGPAVYYVVSGVILFIGLCGVLFA